MKINWTPAKVILLFVVIAVVVEVILVLTLQGPVPTP